MVAAVAIAIAVSFFAGVFVGAVVQHSRRISNQATIKAVGVGVYKDPALTVPLTKINWGILEPGEQKKLASLQRRNARANPLRRKARV